MKNKPNETDHKFTFDFHEQKSIPALAWLAHLKKKESTIAIYHGAWVETAPDFFVEGAWPGKFIEGKFDESDVFFGSGGRLLSDQSVVFSTPTHKWEKLFLIKKDSEIFISNSIVFLLIKSGCQLDENYGKYNEGLWTIKNGIRSYVKQMPLKAGHHLHLYYHRNVVINDDLSVSESFKRDPDDAHFKNFNSYKNFLDDRTAGVFNNAEDTNRKIKYSPITTLSTGYDSACSSVFARRNGCEDALTFSNNGGIDSGAEIAKKLSLKITEIDKMDYLQSDRKFIEGEVLSAGFASAGLYILSLEKYLKARILVTGYYGGHIWNMDNDFNNNQLKTLWTDGSAYTEFRLRAGFIHFILPSMGATKDPLVKAISYSDEMKKWSNGSENYDRPIPTRILTEENVPRHLFGQQKKASGVFNLTNKKPKRKTSSKKEKFIIKIKHLIPEKQRSIIRNQLMVFQNLKEKLLSHISKTHVIKSEIEKISSALSRDSENDLYQFLKKNKNVSFSTGKFIWGIEKAKQNYCIK